ncbi:probable basic-leucine zipper transcription factor F [Nylanderia fulva]|nr:probable basic-leucine zipper transcription factor F [Nylanderia fulva]
MFKWSKTKLIDLINTLQIENKKLREDNARLRALRAINEDLHKMTAMSSTLFKDMDKLRRNIDSLRIKADQSSNKNKNSDNINNNNNNIKLSYLNKDEQKENNISHNAGSTSEIVETQSENSQQQILLSIAHIEQPEKFQAKPSITIEDLTDFAGRQVQTEQ